VLRVLAEHPSESVPEASQSNSQSQSIYRFWANQRVKPEQILSSHRASVLKQMQEDEVVLAIQDTTEDSLCKTLKTKSLTKQPKRSLTNCC
jgi:hypothetical protein